MFISLRLLTLSGRGLISGAGYTATDGDWAGTFNSGGGTFTWSASTAVPDGGTTIALLGASLLGLYGARRKFANP
jgi:hypothetical protein